MERDLWIRWDGPNAGALVNGLGRDLRSFRVLVPGPSRVRARADWYEDKDVLRAGGEVTFSRLDRRGEDPVMRVRFKLGLGPRFDWITKEISLRPPALTVIDPDPWSLGARTRK